MNRKLYLTGFLISAALLATVYYFEYVKGLQPCPLCIMQRIAFFGNALTALVAFLHHPAKCVRRIYCCILSLFALFGAVMASRQIYLQHLPLGQAPPCAPGLNFMLQHFPLHQTLQVLFYGSGDCAQVHWKFLGLAMPEWSLLFLIGFFLSAIIIAWKK